uniref:EGF-like domain-containing protein n=1 Tax=Panagrolaimus sp. ES5 TaxID=591445 RepID=A0AC34FW61_9BILA
PCRDLECTNQGKCVETFEGEAKCQCPESNAIQFIKAEIKGDVCEIIHIDDNQITPQSCMPCSGDFHQWIKCLEKHAIQHGELSFLWKNCEKEDSECYNKLQGKDCFNDGKCNTVIDEFPIDRLNDKLFLVPKCYCSKNFQGDFCQHSFDKLRDPCEEAKDDFKCNGTCLFSEANGLQCLCDYGMKGTRCDIKDPCMPNPCEDNSTICVEIPDGTITPSYSCICGLNQDVDPKSMACITPHHKICSTTIGEPSCKNNGHCYPCALEDDGKITLCTEDEVQRGFRCICPPGFSPPFCDHKVTACSFHKCQNRGICIPKEGTLADYDCECEAEYNGTFCEQSPNICKTDGFAACVHGSCEINVKSGRGFSCKCKEGYFGYNCHIKEEWDFWNEIDVSSFEKSQFN